MNTFQRDTYIGKLAAVIDGAMQNDLDLRMEAIIEGRIGLNEMNDTGLLQFGADCWGVEE